MQIGAVAGNRITFAIGGRQLSPGDVIHALVTEASGEKASLLWGGKQIQAYTQVPLLAGSVVRLEVLNINRQTAHLKIIDYVSPASPGTEKQVSVNLGSGIEEVKAALGLNQAHLASNPAILSLLGYYFKSRGLTRSDFEQLMALAAKQLGPAGESLRQALMGTGSGEVSELREALQRMMDMVFRPLEQHTGSGKNQDTPGMRALLGNMLESILADDQNAGAKDMGLLLGLEAKLAAIQALTSWGIPTQAIPLPWEVFRDLKLEIDPDNDGREQQLRAFASLEDDHLGRVDVEVLVTGKKVTVEMWVANDTIRSLVFESSSELSRSLGGIGYHLEPLACRLLATSTGTSTESSIRTGRLSRRNFDLRA